MRLIGLFLHDVAYLVPVPVVAAVAVQRPVRRPVGHLRARTPIKWVAGLLVIALGLLIAAR